MNREELLSLLKERNAIIEGHFRLTSGLHSCTYLQMALLLQDPIIGQRMGSLIGERFSKDEVNVVVGPALGGIIIGYMVGLALRRESIFTERGADGTMQLRRGFHLEEGSRVLIVEDVITTGGSVKEVMDVIEKRGGEVIGIASIVDRSTEVLPIPITSLLRLMIHNYREEECPLCKEGIPLDVPGSRSLKR